MVPEKEPTEEKVVIDGEEKVVWPERCTRPGANCRQCTLEGKIQCDPKLSLPALSREEKTAIAREAKERGVKVVAAERQLPMIMVRSWVGAYCRQPSAKGGRREKKSDVDLPGPPQPGSPEPEQKVVESVPPVKGGRREKKGAVTLVELDLGDCAFCEDTILDNVDGERPPSYIDTPTGRLWFCFDCAGGLKRVLPRIMGTESKISRRRGNDL